MSGTIPRTKYEWEGSVQPPPPVAPGWRSEMRPQSTPLVFSQEDVDRFWSRVDRSGGPDACWPWQGPPNGKGYGSLGFGGHVLGAHVVAFIVTHGLVPEGNEVCHHCDNPPCCRPKHLFAGTSSQNQLDCVRKGRNVHRTHPELLARGERHGRYTKPESRLQGRANRGGVRKLTADEARAIRVAYRSGGVTQEQLGQRYGIGQAQVSRIIHGQRWAWLDD